MSSRCLSSTFVGACIIGTLPKTPLVRPRNNENAKAVISAENIGLDLGATHIIIKGIIISLATEQRTRRAPVQYRAEDASIFPETNLSVFIFYFPLNNQEFFLYHLIHKNYILLY